MRLVFENVVLPIFLPDSPSVPMSVVAVVFPITTLHRRLLRRKQHDSLKCPAMTRMVKLFNCWLDNINIIGRSWLSVQHSKSQLIWEHQQRNHNQIFDIWFKYFYLFTNSEWLRQRCSTSERWITSENLFSE